MRKLKTLTALACALILSVVCLGGCVGANDERVIRDALTQELDSFANVDQSMIDAMEEGLGNIDLEEYGLTSEEFNSAYLDGFDYSIDDITVNGDSAQATMTITCKSFSDFSTKLQDATTQLIQGITNGDSSTDDINENIGDMMMNALNSTKLATTDPIVINLTKKNGAWIPDDSASTIIGQAFVSN